MSKIKLTCKTKEKSYKVITDLSCIEKMIMMRTDFPAEVNWLVYSQIFCKEFVELQDYISKTLFVPIIYYDGITNKKGDIEVFKRLFRQIKLKELGL